MKLGYMMLLVAVGAMLVIAPSAMAGEKGKGHGDKNMVFGEVKAVGTDSITITPRVKKDAPVAEDKTITTNKDTKIVTGAKGEEKDGTLADVKVGARVAVTLTEGTTVATKIVVIPAGGEHKKK